MDSQFENTPRHPCYSHFPKGISALSWSFLLENWNKTNVYEMITHYMSCQQCRTVSNSVNSVNSFNSVNSVNNVNSVNSYSAVLPPSPMVFFFTKYKVLFVLFAQMKNLYILKMRKNDHLLTWNLNFTFKVA